MFPLIITRCNLGHVLVAIFSEEKNIFRFFLPESEILNIFLDLARIWFNIKMGGKGTVR